MRPNKNTLKLLLSEKFSGMIWKIKVHESGIIAVETRNSELKQVAFSAFNFATGEIYFKEKLYEESWNLSLVFAGEYSLLLNGYEHAETPENKGVLAINVEDGSVLWQKFNISLNRVENDGLEVYDPRVQPRKYTWLSHLSGEVISVPDSLQGPDSLLFPSHEDTFVIPGFIKHGTLAGELLNLHHSDKVFLSFHEAESNYLRQRLIVYQGDTILLDDILISGIQKLQPEAFFIQQNHLFYIRNKEEIFAYLV